MDAHTQEVMEALGFSLKDLKKNHEGWVSDRQEKLAHAEDREKRTTILAILAVIPLILILVIGGIIALYNETLAYCILSIIGIVGFAIYVWVQEKHPRRYWHPEIVEGRIALTGGIGGYTLLIGEHRFSIPKDAFFTFRNHDPYRIYYANGQLIAAEWLAQSPFEEADDEEQG